MRKLSPEAVAITIELQQLLYDIGHEIDANLGRGITDYYCEDGAFVVGDRRYEGRAKISAFYVAEGERVRRDLKDGQRQLLHAFVNPRVFVHDTRNATIECFNINYSDAGASPIAGPIAPNLIVACKLVFRLEDDGLWRIVEFSGTPQFTAKTIVQHPAATAG